MSYALNLPGRGTGSTLHFCQTCGKQFNRSDSLKRHDRTHDRGHQNRKSRRRACLACVKSKTRCSEESPTCERCERTGLLCSYATEKQRPIRHINSVSSRANGRQQEAEGGDRSSNNSAALRDLFLENQDGHISSQVLTNQGHEESQLALDLPVPTEQLPWPEAAVSQFIGIGDFYPMVLSPSVCDGFSASSLNFPNDFARNLPFSSLAQCPIPVSAEEMEAIEPQPWRGDSMYNYPSQSQSVETQLECPPPGARQFHHLLDNRHQSQQPAASTHDENIFPATSPATGSASEVANCLPELWSDPSFSSSVYPTRFALPPVGDTTHRTMRECCRLPLLQSPWQAMSLSWFPSGKQLDYFIDLYFSNFDTLMPMIHRPTFDPGAHPILTLSVCAVGALYSDFENAQEFVSCMGELLRRLMVFMSEQNVFVRRNYDYLAALTLQSVLSNSSGDKRLFELGDDNRGQIVVNARAVGLFTRRPPQQTFDLDQGGSLQSRWHSWIHTERWRRLAWCIFIFDASATYYRNSRPHISLAEMTVDLPCPTSYWQAESVQVWATLRPSANGAAPPNVAFSKTVRRLFETHTTSSSAGQEREQFQQDAGLNNAATAEKAVTDEFHGIILATTLFRMIWDHRESMRGPEPPIFFLPRPVSYTDFNDNINILLSVLKEFTSGIQKAAVRAHNLDNQRHNCTSEPDFPGVPNSHEEREFQGLVHRSRISLVAQIIAADHISDHLDAEWPYPQSSESSNISTTTANITPTKLHTHEVAIARLRAWAESDPVQPRRMAHVGARLLAICRLYPYHMPREPYDTFRAGLLLWTMVPLLRVAAPAQTQSEQRICQLDWLGEEDTPEAETVRDWIEHGGDHFVLRIQGISDLRSEQGRRQVLQTTSDVLRRLRVWGSSKTYRDIILRVLREGDGG